MLLDRGTRIVLAMIVDARRSEERSRARLLPMGPLRLVRESERLDRASRVLPLHAGARLGSARAALESGAASLSALGPQATLARGYAIVRRRRDGQIVRDPADAPAGERLSVRVARGEIPATVDDDSR
jgi:exodeoxyribonuclease VII large subunit